MNESLTPTPYESLDNLEADHAAEDDLGAAATAAYCESRGDNSKVCLQDEKPNDDEVSYKNEGVTEIQTVDVPRITNSPGVNVPRNTNSPNGREARANTPNSSQNSSNPAANVGQTGSGQNQNLVSRSQLIYQGVAKHPEYADEPKRRGTFQNWPARLQQSPEMMSGAGFFFSLNGDSVRCFLCGIGLRNWDQDDNPWVEHARWSPKCSYVLEKKGQSFINLVQDAVRNAELQQALRENNERHGNGNSIRGHQAQGADNVQTDQSANPQNNVVSAAQRPGRPDHFPSDAERKNPLLCDAAQSVLNMGYLPRVVKQCLNELLKLEGWHSMSGKKLMKMIMDKEENGSLDPLLSVVPAQRPPKKLSHVQMLVPKALLEQENAALKERTLCKICLQSTVAIVFLPCGHLVSCGQCAPALKNCPICRGPMKATVRVSFG